MLYGALTSQSYLHTHFSLLTTFFTPIHYVFRSFDKCQRWTRQDNWNLFIVKKFCKSQLSTCCRKHLVKESDARTTYISYAFLYSVLLAPWNSQRGTHKCGKPLILTRETWGKRHFCRQTCLLSKGTQQEEKHVWSLPFLTNPTTYSSNYKSVSLRAASRLL